MVSVESSFPYKWPYNGDLRPDNTAVMVIDMQVDFCGKGGYVDLMGYDLSLTQAPIQPIKRVLEACRAAGYHIIHTREGHRPDLSDLPANKKWRSQQIGAAIGDAGPSGSRLLVRGEPGWEIIPELAPTQGEVVIDKPGKGSFYATDLDLILKCRGIQNIVLTGVTTDVCVHTTMREANDRGYECLLLKDCTAATDTGNHEAAIKMVTMQGGVFGAVADSAALIAAVSSPVAAEASSGPRVQQSRVLQVNAEPYDYQLRVGRTALLMIDFQRDVMMQGGYGATQGNDVHQLMACLPAAVKLLSGCRRAGIPVVHTLESHQPDLSDLQLSKASRGNWPAAQCIGAEGPMGRFLVKGQQGNAIMEEVAAVEGERVMCRPGKSAFYKTDLEAWLHGKGISHLILAGVTTEVCVQSTMREANDRGFECLLVADATGSYFPTLKEATLQMITSQSGIVGWVTGVEDVLEALHVHLGAD